MPHFRRMMRNAVATASSKTSSLSTSRSLLAYVLSHPANRDNRCRALAKLLGWQAWQRATRRPWNVGLSGGMCLRCYPHSTAASAVLYCRLPDWEDMNFVLDVLRPGDVFVDVGANVGVYSLLAATVPRVHVWSFEPSSFAFSRALENVKLNNLESRVRVVKAAVGSQSGVAMLTRGMDTVNHIVEKGDVGDVEEVDVVVLDEFLNRHVRSVVGIVKVDVEGRELDVLMGARELLRSTAPALIVERNAPVELGRFLGTYGYSAHRYDVPSKQVIKTSWESCNSNNVLAIRDTERFNARLRFRASS